ncbi:MAG TPA: CBS domain-containing protein [Thermoanaerobaculia bacterium]|nr:CBS domain-containing protein [Thermoanaerobaculia bacterium]
MSALRVRDLMSDRVYSVRPDDDLATVRDLMDDHAIRHVPVVDEDGDLVGLVSHRDLLRTALIERDDLPEMIERSLLESTKVREVMTPYVETVAPELELSEAAQLLVESKFSSLPVADQGHLIGMLTEADFVRHFARSA